ncbi:TonB-dependent receptor, partial [mine drainage metagenome]
RLSRGSATLLGRVTQKKDDEEIPVSANIKAKNLETHEIYTLNSGQDGNYALTQIPAGTYLLQVTKNGFTPESETIDISGKVREDISLHINRMARAEIQAEGNKKIQDNTGAISIVDQKKFQQNLSTGAAYTLMQNSPSIEYYSRSGSQGISGGMNYMS